MPRSTKEEALETRNRILDAAEDVFHARGVAVTSLGNVAEAAGVTRGAIYWHFKNKGDLFNAMCERVQLPMEAMVAAGAGADTHDPLGQLRDTCIHVLRHTARDPHSFKVFGILFHRCEFVDGADAAFARQRESFRNGARHIEATLANAKKRGQLAPEFDVRLGAIALHAALDGVLNNWLFAPDSFDLDAHAEALVDGCIEQLVHAQALRRCR